MSTVAAGEVFQISLRQQPPMPANHELRLTQLVGPLTDYRRLFILFDNLERLDVGRNANCSFLQPCADLPEVRSLAFSSGLCERVFATRGGDLLFETVTQLTHLSIGEYNSDCEIRGAHAASLSNLVKLKERDLRIPASPFSMYLPGFTGLTSLTCMKWVDKLQYLSHLQDLKICVTDRPFDPFMYLQATDLRKLQRLEVGGLGVCLENIHRSAALTSLHLHSDPDVRLSQEMHACHMTSYDLRLKS